MFTFFSNYILLKEKKCKLAQDWGYLKENIWYFSDIIKYKINQYKCFRRTIIRVDDFKYLFGNWSKLNHGERIDDEVFEVVCKKFDKIIYDNLFVQILNKLNKNQEEKKITNNNNEKCKKMNVILISYDSVSRSAWFNRLPKSTKYALETMNFELLNGYNIVGDGTPAALIPIYTGKTEEELPSVLKNDPNGKLVDEAYPFIWKDLHAKNYMTMHLDDWPHIGAFTFRMKGFLNYTTKHYFKHYQLRLWDRVSKYYFSKHARLDDFCIGSKKRHQVLMDLILDFKKMYKQKANNLILMHYVENSHDSNTRLNWIDNELYDLLEKGNTQNLFNDTAIFLFSDHGARFNDKRSDNRYLEERLPFFSVYLPDQYKKDNAVKFENLKKNSKLLTSPFDIYATIRDLTCLDDKDQDNNRKKRSISLLKEISPTRNCDDIGISEHYCTCEQNWKSLKTNDLTIIQAAKFTVDSINKITELTRKLCLKLELKEIISSEVLNKSGLLMFKIQLITSPNEGIYESLLFNANINEYEFKSNEFSIKSRNDISRIDAYGSQPYCVSNFENNPEHVLDLRKFCYCKPKYKARKLKRINNNHKN